MIDVGVGVIVSGNFHCYGCGWSLYPPTDEEMGLEPFDTEDF